VPEEITTASISMSIPFAIPKAVTVGSIGLVKKHGITLLRVAIRLLRK
jgi:hypothetical protein